MHEYSIVMSLIDAVRAEMDLHGASSVRRVVVRVGELSGVDPELLVTAYSTFSQDTVCRDAELELKHVSADWRCSQCGAPIRRGEVLRCAECRIPVTLHSGDEIILESIEMEVP